VAWPEDIRVPLGQPFEVSLEETSTSGYCWRVSAVPDGLELAESDLDPPSRRSPVGASGRRRFVFRTSRPGAFTLTFDLQREWETEPLQHHIVRVEVDEPN